MESINIGLETLDFDYWTNNRIDTLLAINKRKEVNDIRSISLITNINYASTHQIVKELVQKNLVFQEGRKIRINPEWKILFMLADRRRDTDRQQQD